MRSHKAVVFNFCICTTKRYGANPHYALPTRLGTFSKSLDGPQDYLPTQIPMRVDMHRKLKKLYMKKVGIRRPPQTH